jgi:hypothetical protein
VICSFGQFLLRNAGFRPGGTRQSFSVDGPNLGLFGWGHHGWVPWAPWATSVGPGPAGRPWPVLARFWVVFVLFGSFSPCPSPRHHAELHFLRRVHLDARMKAGFPRDLGCSFSHDLVRHIRPSIRQSIQPPWLAIHLPIHLANRPPIHPSNHAHFAASRSNHAHFATSP